MKPLSRTFLAAVCTLVFTLACGGYTIARVEDVAPQTDALETPGTPTPVPVAATPPASGIANRPPPTAPTTPPPPPAGTTNGQIQVTTLAAVQAVVDGVPVAFDMNQGYVLDVSPGSHSLEIVNLLGRPVATQTVRVESGKRARFNYRKKVLSSSGTVPYTKIVAAPVPTTPVPSAAVLGSAQLDGFTPLTDRVWVNGKEVAFDQARAGFVVRALPAGEHNLRVERSGQVVYQGAIGIRDAENHRCIAVLGSDWRWTLSCHYTTPQL